MLPVLRGRPLTFHRKTSNPSQPLKKVRSLYSRRLPLVVFLDKVESFDPLPSGHVEFLERTYGIDKTENAEIKLRFYQIALKSGPRYAEKAAGESRVLLLANLDSLGDKQGADEVLPPNIQATEQAGSRVGQEDLPGTCCILRGSSKT